MLLKKYALLKYFGLLLGVSAAFLQPALFSRYLSHNEFAFLSVLYGIVAYLAFCDLGMHKPIYSRIRQAQVNGQDQSQQVQKSLSYYVLMMIVVFTAFSTLLTFLGRGSTSEISTSVLLFFSFAASANLFINYVEYLFNALELQVAFQKIDILRRIANLGSLLLLHIDHTFFWTIFSNAMVLMACCIFAAATISKTAAIKIDLSVRPLINFAAGMWSKARDSLILTVNDTLIYNFGFLLLPFFVGATDIIFYSLWLKIFFGGALIIRIIIDIHIHDITRRYFSFDYSGARHLILRSTWLSLGVVIVLVSTLFFANSFIFKYWVKSINGFSSENYAALGMWLGALAIQSSAGVFLLAQGQCFAFMRNTSFLIMLGVCGSFFTLIASKLPLGSTLVLVGLINLVGSLVYLKKSLSIASNSTEIK